MAKSIGVITKRMRGRPVTTGKGTLIGVRLLDGPLAGIDAWIAKQKEPDLSRPEAIRRLVELGLMFKSTAKPTNKAKRSSRARELASTAVDKMSDPNANPELRDERRKMLIKGPSEFRESRVDLPKRKS